MDFMLIDSHCHLHDREFFSEEQAEECLKRAREKNVQKIVCIGTSHEDSLAAAKFANNHDDVYWTYGIHPENALGLESAFSSVGLEFSSTSYAGRPGKTALKGSFLGAVRNIRVENSNHFYTSEKVDSKPPIAIGEVGLDYHYDDYNRTAQIRLFEEMLQLAVDNDLPLSFHVRNAFSDFFPIVENFPTVRGCVHSFTDSKKTLKRILENTDFYVGVNGLATYSTLPTPPLERILLETDAPFLTPVPFRGMINEPRYIFNIAEWLSQKLGVEFEIIEKVTTENAERLFRFPSSRTTERAE